MEYTEVTFPDRKDLNSLSNFHHKGGELYDGMPVICERNYRTPLINGILKSWFIGEVKYDITGMGKYSASHCIVEINGKESKWAFSMIYVKDNK